MILVSLVSSLHVVNHLSSSSKLPPSIVLPLVVVLVVELTRLRLLRIVNVAAAPLTVVVVVD